MTRRLAAALASVVLVLAATGPLAQSRDDVALRAAIETETIKGDLKLAIDQYRKLVDSGNRAVAAQALLRLAGCYEKLGRAEAAATYAQVVQKFGDQPAVVAEARRRMNEAPSPATTRGPSVELLASTRDNRVYGGSVSSDGRYIALQDRRWIFVLDLVTGEKKLVASPTSPQFGLRQPLISPDGRLVVFVEASAGAGNAAALEPASRDPRLDIVSSDGTGRRTLASLPGPEPLDWSSDGKQVLVSSSGRPSRFHLVSTATGAMTDLPLPAGIVTARLSPDGRYLAMTGTRRGQGLLLYRLADGAVTQILEAGGVLNEWAPDGSRVLYTAAQGSVNPTDWKMWSVRIVDGRAQGDPQFLRGGIPGPLGVTAEGGYLYRTASWTRGIYAVDIDPDTGAPAGRPRQYGTFSADARGPAFSPDGQRVAYLAARPFPAAATLYVRTHVGGPQQALEPPIPAGRLGPGRLQAGLSTGQPVEWFPDNRSVLVLHNSRALSRVDAETGEFTPVLPDFRLPAHGAGGYASVTDLSPDGRLLYYVVNAPGPDASAAPLIAKVDLESGETSEVLRAHGRVNGIGLSPDGNEIAYTVVDGEGMGRRHTSVMIAPVSGGTPRMVHGVDGVALRDVVWGRDGQRLFMTSSINRFDGPITTEVGADIWTVRVDGTDAKPLGIGLNDQYYLNIHPNGRQLIFMDENYRNELWIMRGLFPPAAPGR